jgi:hypothetical protein
VEAGVRGGGDPQKSRRDRRYPLQDHKISPGAAGSTVDAFSLELSVSARLLHEIVQELAFGSGQVRNSKPRAKRPKLWEPSPGVQIVEMNR